MSSGPEALNKHQNVSERCLTFLDLKTKPPLSLRKRKRGSYAYQCFSVFPGVCFERLRSSGAEPSSMATPGILYYVWKTVVVVGGKAVVNRNKDVPLFHLSGCCGIPLLTQPPP